MTVTPEESFSKLSVRCVQWGTATFLRSRSRRATRRRESFSPANRFSRPTALLPTRALSVVMHQQCKAAADAP